MEHSFKMLLLILVIYFQCLNEYFRRSSLEYGNCIRGNGQKDVSEDLHRGVGVLVFGISLKCHIAFSKGLALNKREKCFSGFETNLA